VYEGVSAPEPDDPVELLSGSPHMTEQLFGLSFKLVPGAFFQTNTPACEVLYRTVMGLVNKGDDVTLLDVCCGTGTIGICAAAEGAVKRVIGIELCQRAVDCAVDNAAANGVGGAVTFTCARAEHVLRQTLDAHRAQQAARVAAGADASSAGTLVAVVDPPRAGLHRSCLEAIRNCSAIMRLVYVSCNPTGSMVADMEALCGPGSKALSGKPFVPALAVPVDLFPSTDHCEMVIAFDRDTADC